MTLAGDLACALDPVRLAERAGLAPDPWQARALRAAAPRLLLCCARQTGKTTVAAVRAVHTALYAPGALVVVVAPSLRQSIETFRQVLAVYRALGQPVPAAAASALRLELAHGSRVVALPGKEPTIRGLAGVRLLIVDEAARVPDELYYAVRPMLAVSGGRLLVLSTPFGRRGFFYREWTAGADWERILVRADECPRIPARFLAEERAALPARWYRQEYECTFEDVVDQVFSAEQVRGALRADVAPLFPEAGAAGGLAADRAPLPLVRG
jgi:hypothetical protein